MNQKLQITRLRRTCGGCPTQWEGEDSEANPIYIRFRWGYLSVRQEEKNEDVISAVRGQEIFGRQISTEFDGVLSFEELKNIVKTDLIEINCLEEE